MSAIVCPPGAKPAKNDRERVLFNLRYWVDNNTFDMGEHDLNVLRLAIRELEKKS